MYDYTTFSGIILMFILGLRHGLDPDHIAVIDGMTFRHIEHRHAFAPWVGTLFALGHGLVVTLIAVGVSLFATSANLIESLPASALSIAEWIPTALLILVGWLNLNALLRDEKYQATGWKTRLLPRRLRETSHPAGIVFVGVLFALVFDTATQAAAWGYVATAQGGLFMALIIGLVFTFGMVLTDTVDGRLVCRMLQNGDAAKREYYRRLVGMVIVVLSFSVAGYKILAHFFPQLEMSTTTYSITGLVMLGGALVFYLRLIWLAKYKAHSYQEHYPSN